LDSKLDWLDQDNLKFYMNFSDPHDAYLHNSSICSAWYTPLRILEESLRQRITESLNSVYGGNIWNRFDEKIQKQVHEIKKHTRQENRWFTHLHFGFWTTLFNSECEQAFWNPCNKLLFPNMPKKRRQRHEITLRVNQLRHLRNKIFHHGILLGIDHSVMMSYLVDLFLWMGGNVHEFYQYYIRGLLEEKNLQNLTALSY
jgi:hypothetical protein